MLNTTFSNSAFFYLERLLYYSRCLVHNLLQDYFNPL